MMLSTSAVLCTIADSKNIYASAVHRHGLQIFQQLPIVLLHYFRPYQLTMAGPKKSASKVTNASYCVSTAVSDFVLMSSCVYGKNGFQQMLWLTTISRCVGHVSGELEEL